ncbi:hypothetical protein ROU88_06295 [Macrococcus capreoli]|uniref:hypothetical protein n=1 Tax=Macrococcus capreoli TaxID=2982690 RepID=UPI003F4213ED
METLSICFSKEETSLLNGNHNNVPDVLLIKAWYQSQYFKQSQLMKHVKQFITHNEIVVDTVYRVVIQLIDQRTIKHYEQYTYEMHFYLNNAMKATVISTYSDEVAHAISNHG